MKYIDLEMETNYSTHHYMDNRVYNRGDMAVVGTSLYECLSDNITNEHPINSNNWRIIL